MNLGCAQTAPSVIVTSGVVPLPSSYLFLHVQENRRHLVSMATDNKISTAAQGHGRIFRLLGLQVSPRKGYSSHFRTKCEHQPQN